MKKYLYQITNGNIIMFVCAESYKQARSIYPDGSIYPSQSWYANKFKWAKHPSEVKCKKLCYAHKSIEIGMLAILKRNKGKFYDYN